MFSNPPVKKSAEFDRVSALPRRAPIDQDALAAFAVELSRALLTPRGRSELDRALALPADERDAVLARLGKEGRPLMMRPLQAQVLNEARLVGGVYVSAAVGMGKTLISYLLPRVMGAKNALLLVPASLKEKTLAEFAKLSEFWGGPVPNVASYETIGAVSQVGYLCDCPACGSPEDGSRGACVFPDLLICDESDVLRNASSARTKRIGRYIVNHAGHVRACFMTGTPMRKSIRNVAPQIVWALRLGAPVPLGWVGVQEWCEAIDEDGDRGSKRSPGVLVELATEAERSTLDAREAARAGFARRLFETPGVISSEGQSSDAPLSVRVFNAPEDKEINAAFDYFRANQATLDGWDVDDPLSAMRYAVELGAGFYYKWDPRPPFHWLEARREASIFVREKIKNSQRGKKPLDTRAQVYRAYADAAPLLRWKEVEPSFVPNTVAVPVSMSPLFAASEWIDENGPALIWVSHAYVGETLAKMTGVPYFGGGGKTETGASILKHSPKKSAILSIRSNMRGRNLQAWNRALVVTPPQAATEWEQGVFGRMHRQGQTKPVSVDVMMSCAESLHALDRAQAEARFVHRTAQHYQKLLLAEFEWSGFDPVLRSLPENNPARSRWNKPE